MKLFSFIRRDCHGKVFVSHRSGDSFIERIKHDTATKDVQKIRWFVKRRGSTEGCTKAERLPWVFPLAKMEKGPDGALEVRECSGLAWLHVCDIQKSADIEAVKMRVSEQPMTYAAFAGGDGRSVEVLVAVTTQDGVMPKGERDITTFCVAAYKLACSVYSNILPVMVGAVEVNARSAMMMPLDPEPYYNPGAAPMRLNPDYTFESSKMEPSAAEDKIVRDRADKGGRRAKVMKDLLEFLEKRYTFRRDVMLERTEYQDVNDVTMQWRLVTDRVLNSISVEATMNGIDVRDKDVKRIVESSLIGEYDAATAFLRRRDVTWDGKTDHIGMLARRVKCNVPQWEAWFRKWFLYMVAQWLGMPEEYGNATVPLLISGQGYNKSTFCRMLLPEQLRKYYNDNLQANEKVQMLRAMYQYLLINMDEFNQISPRLQAGFLKNMLQLASIKGRRAYGKSEEEFPRKASFIATTNETSVLVDPTGSRRFIGVELKEPIDVSGHINYEQLYGQALWLLKNGEQYWFTKDEEAEIMAHNKQYAMVPPVVQLFLEHYEIVDDEAYGEWTTATAIYEYLRTKAGAGLEISSVNVLGRYISPLFGAHNRKRRHSQVFYLVRKSILNTNDH